MQKEVKEKPQYAVVASVQLPGVSDVEFEASLTELRELAKTLGFTVTRTFTQKRSGFDSTAYLGVGKRQEIRHFVKGESGDETEPDHAPMNPLYRLSTVVEGMDDKAALVSPDPIDVIFVDHEISRRRRATSKNEVGCQVMDRTMVISRYSTATRALPLRAHRWRSRAWATWRRACARRPKLAGPQGRQRSGVGGRGAGESHTELDSARSATASPNCRRRLLRWTWSARRSAHGRQAHQGLASVALVGYTNAGKSTLMRALTGSEVLVANKLFATLDTTVRSLYPRASRACWSVTRSLHQESAARAGRVVQVDARRGTRCLAAAPRHRRQRSRLRAADLETTKKS